VTLPAAGNQKHLAYPFYDSTGRFSGASTTIEEPFSQGRQWQAYLTGLCGGLLQQQSVAEMRGFYTVSYQGDKFGDLRVTRIQEQSPTDLVARSEALPAGTLGLLAIVDESPHPVSSAILALRGGVDSTSGALLPDRVVATGLHGRDAINSAELPASARGQLAAFGRGLLGALDLDLNKARGR
jgi:hypothetical protein